MNEFRDFRLQVGKPDVGTDLESLHGEVKCASFLSEEPLRDKVVQFNVREPFVDVRVVDTPQNASSERASVYETPLMMISEWGEKRIREGEVEEMVWFVLRSDMFKFLSLLGCVAD
ncbi:hypothetical protein [Roseibium sp.]|uniref:hypothetical protein n=1 Tax=Roseibium sp. TaxID=1936156 RepID=UPI003A9841B8